MPSSACDWSSDVCSRSEEHTSELQSHSEISYAVFCLKKKIESLGWRIIKPGISLSGDWNKAFVLGVLRSSGGALLCGLLPFSIGAILPGTRDWSLSHPALLWSTGAGTFLIAI